MCTKIRAFTSRGHIHAGGRFFFLRTHHRHGLLLILRRPPLLRLPLRRRRRQRHDRPSLDATRDIRRQCNLRRHKCRAPNGRYAKDAVVEMDPGSHLTLDLGLGGWASTARCSSTRACSAAPSWTEHCDFVLTHLGQLLCSKILHKNNYVQSFVSLVYMLLIALVFFSRSCKKFARICTKVDKLFHTTCPDGILGYQ